MDGPPLQDIDVELDVDRDVDIDRYFGAVKVCSRVS